MQPSPDTLNVPAAPAVTPPVARQAIACTAGYVSSTVGIAMLLAAGWGTSPIDAFIAGSAATVGVSFGVAFAVFSAVCVAAGMAVGVRPGLMTAVTFTSGFAVDRWLLLPLPSGPAASMAGAVALGVGAGLVLSAGWGASPVDMLLQAANILTGRPVWLLKVAIDVVMVAAALSVGGPVAWGTAAAALLIGPSVGVGCWLCVRILHPLRPTSSRAATAASNPFAVIR